MDRFIVGTGRCGSTLLSRMLAESPDVLSVFEFFNGVDASRRFSPQPVSGREFVEVICAVQPVLRAVLWRGYPVEEVTYPFGPGARYERGDALPWILASMLPRLSETPDLLLDELVAHAAKQPARPFPAHARGLFEWLGECLGRPHWIERSGSSVEYLPALVEAFPEARFVHLHREGAEVALSMREHHAYRLPISLLYQTPLEDGLRPADLGAIDWTAPPTPDDAISRILRSRPEPAGFGRYWSDQLLRGAPALAALREQRPPRLLELRFEELVSRPRELLGELAAFFGLAGGAWLERAAGLVRSAPRRRLPDLDPRARRALLEACAPGTARLAS